MIHWTTQSIRHKRGGITMHQRLKIGDFVDFIRPANQPSDMEMNASAKWFCAVVRPGCHRRAELELSRLGFRSFFPKSRRWASHARTKKAVERPILGRYLFVEIDHPRQSFATVRDIFDIESLVSSLGSPVPFPAVRVEDMLQRYMAGEFDEIANGHIPVGARIRIIEGEFENMLATVTRSRGRRVDFRMLGDARVLRIDQSSVRAA